MQNRNIEVVLYYGLYVVLGMVAGTLSGLLGIGGGIIVVPGLLWLFQAQGVSSSIIMQVATGTSLGAMIVTSGFSTYAHYYNGARFVPILYRIVPGLIVGTTVGTILAYYTYSEVLRILFGLLLLWVAFREFFSTTQKSLRKKHLPHTLTPRGLKILSGIIGILSGLLGLGGGTLIIPLLEYNGMDIRKAVSTTAACGCVIALTGTVGFMLSGLHDPHLPAHSIGFVYLPAVIGVSIGSPLFTFLGAKLHYRLPVSILKRLFSVFLVVVAIKLLIS